MIVLGVHWPALSARALSFDDETYLTNNALVKNPGLGSAGRFLGEVLEPSTVMGYYQPLTMISLMADYAQAESEKNLEPFHQTSLLLHIANTLLVVFILYLLFGHPLPAALIGLMFGVHPMTVEPIPWIGERKTLLAGFFSLWCLVCYIRYARTHSWKWYAAGVIAYVLALMSKPTSVPIPIVLLALDFWPLGRLSRRAVMEKVPFFVLGVVSAMITYISQQRMGGIMLPGEYSWTRIPLVLCYNLVFYLGKIFWPANISFHYPFPEPFSLRNPMVLAGVVGTAVVAAGVIISMRRTRAVVTGLLIFYLALLPTMQIVAFSPVIAADKYAYFPFFGVLLILMWALSGWWSRVSARGRLAGVLVLMVPVVLAAGVTHRLAGFWKDTESLDRYMVSHNPQSCMVRYKLGTDLCQAGSYEEGIIHLREAARIDPNYELAPMNLGLALDRAGRPKEAVEVFKEWVKRKPDSPAAHLNLADLLDRIDKPEEAIEHYKRAIQIKPDFTQARYNLAVMLAQRGKMDQAEVTIQEAIRAQPKMAMGHYVLGGIYMMGGKKDQAAREFQEALRIDPDFRDARECLGQMQKMPASGYTAPAVSGK